MPEMLELCGQRFRVSKRAYTVCIYEPGTPLGFNTDDVVTLEGVRCSGAAHDGCQKSCTIFWREAWLRKVDHAAVQSQAASPSAEQLQARLKVSIGPETYYCQASELKRATHSLSKRERIRGYLSGLRAGNFGSLEMAQSIGIWLVLENPQDVPWGARAGKQRGYADRVPKPPAWRMGRSEIVAEHQRDVERARVQSRDGVYAGHAPFVWPAASGERSA